MLLVYRKFAYVLNVKGSFGECRSPLTFRIKEPPQPRRGTFSRKTHWSAYGRQREQCGRLKRSAITPSLMPSAWAVAEPRLAAPRGLRGSASPRYSRRELNPAQRCRLGSPDGTITIAVGGKVEAAKEAPGPRWLPQSRRSPHTSTCETLPTGWASRLTSVRRFPRRGLLVNPDGLVVICGCACPPDR